MRSVVARALSSLLVFALAAGAAPRRPATMPSQAESIEVALVNLDVVVTDAQGNHVRGLKREDFAILEDGKPQPVTHFAEYGDAERTESAPEQQRSVLLFVEIFHLPTFRVETFVTSMKDFVRKSVRKGDAVAVIAYDEGAELRVPPTSDLATVEAALDQIGRECAGLARDDKSAVAHDMGQLRAFEAGGAEMAADHNVFRPGTSGSSMAANAARVPILAAQLEMKRRISAINASIHALSAVEGRKILLLATHRLSEFVGAEFLAVAGAGGEVFDNRGEVMRIIANANASGVTVYPLFPAGLDQTPADPSTPDVSRTVLMNEMSMLTEIAQQTGGLTSYGTTDIAKLLPRVAKDLSTYYSVAYRRNRPAGSGAISVTVKDPKLTVRTRRQILERTDDARMRDRMLAALYDGWRESQLAVTAEIGTVQKKGKKHSVPLKIHVPIRDLTLLPDRGGHSGSFTVHLLSGAQLGEISSVVRETRAITIPAEKLEALRRGNVTYEVELLVNPEAERVAIGVLDEVGKTYAVLAVPLPK
jgi:VWFA-related protein